MTKYFLFLVVLMVAVGCLSQQYYDYNTGLEYYYYSNVAFCPDDVIKSWSCESPCQNTPGMTDLRIAYDPALEIKAYIGYQSKSNKIVVSFRGSADIENWILDGHYFFQNYELCEGCKVHSGFYGAFLSVKEQVSQNLDDMTPKYPGAQIYFTGHSLGAALATVGALEMRYQGFQVEALYNYGSPRIGNPEYAQYIQSQIPSIFRHTHWHDLVPHLPLFIMGFKHVTQEVWQVEDGSTYTLCSETNSEDPLCSNSVPTYKLTPLNHLNYFGKWNKCNGHL